MKLFLKIFNGAGFSETIYPTIISYLRSARRVAGQGDVDIVLKRSASEVYNAGKYQPSDANVLLDYLFRGIVLTARNAPPPVEFVNFVNVFVNYFQNNLLKFDEGLLEKIFGKDKLNDPSSRARVLIPWEEYNKYKVPNILPDQQLEGEEDNSENNENNQNKKAKNRRREFYDKKDFFLNRELTELENKMERIGIPTSSLSGVSKDTVANFVDSVYRMAA